METVVGDAVVVGGIKGARRHSSSSSSSDDEDKLWQSKSLCAADDVVPLCRH